MLRKAENILTNLFTSKRKKLIISVFSFAILISFIFLSILYAIFNHLHIENVKVMTRDNAQEIAVNYISSVESLKGIANQIYSEALNDSFFQNTSSEIDKFNYLNDLSRYLSYNKYIYSVYIMNDSKIYVIGTNDQIADPEAYFKENYSYSFPIINTDNGDNPTNSRKAITYTLIFHKTVGSDKAPKDAVMIVLNKRWAEQFGDTRDSYLYAVTPDNKCILNTLPNISDEEWSQIVRTHQKESKHFDRISISSLDNEIFYYTYYGLDNIKFILLSKESSFIANFRNALIIIMLITLIFCVIISTIFLFSKLLYKKNLQEINRNLALSEKRFSDSKDDLKMNYLFQQLQKPVPSEFENKKRELSILVDLNEPIRIALFQIDECNNFTEKYTLAEQTDLVNKATKLIHSLLSPLHNEPISIINQRCFFMINDSCNKATVSLFANIKERLYSEFSLIFSCFISNVGILSKDGTSMYNEVLIAKKQKLIKGYGCIIFCNNIVPSTTPLDISLFNQKEQLIIASIKNTQYDNAKKIFHGLLFEDLPNYNLDGALTMVKKLLFSICLEIQKQTHIRNSYSLLKIDTVECIQEAETIFDELIATSNSDESLLNSRLEYLIFNVDRFIDENFQDANLSISTIASSVHLSAGYLGQLYRRYRNTSISETINIKRVERAKELLETTNRSIMDIAESVGITNKTQLYNLFKKHYGTTPVGIRKNFPSK